MDKTEELVYLELKKIASEKGLESVGVSQENLIKNIKEYNRKEADRIARSTISTEEEKEVKGEEIKVKDDEVKDEEVKDEMKHLFFNGKLVTSINNKIIAGRSFKEVSLFTGEILMATKEEFKNNIEKK